MRVRRLGRIFGAEDGAAWMHSHAAYPAPVLMDSSRIRLFIVSRDSDNRGSVGFVDLDTSDPTRILDVSARPCLTPGALGTFSHRGISIGSISRVGASLWLYYMGWNKSVDVPFQNAIGLAVCADGTGEHFQPAFEGPLLDRSRFDPFTVSYPFVIPPKGPAEKWTMYYGTSRAGGDREENMQHVITSASSGDGIDWRPSGADVVALKDGEYGLSRPWCCRVGGRDLMLFSIRRAKYAIGAAEISGGGTWSRLTDDLLGPSTDPWESEASCYPATIAVQGRTLLFYNGNGYGKTGVGVAEILD
ncbi:MAG: hypothetical protein ACTHN2_02320 [Nitrobacter sp.]